jgi:hypothetical protein
LAQAPAWSFRDTELQDLNHRYFHNVRYNPDMEDTERPLKRARLSDINGEDSTFDLRSMIMNKISDLLGLPENSALADLTAVAV